MPINVIKTEELRQMIFQSSQKKIAELSRKPSLAVIQSDNNPSTELYIKNKKKQADLLDIPFHIYKTLDKQSFDEIVDWLTADSEVDTILLQCPMVAEVNIEDLKKNILLKKKEVENILSGDLVPHVFGRALILTYLWLKNISEKDKIDFGENITVYFNCSENLTEVLKKELARENIQYIETKKLIEANLIFSATGKPAEICAEDIGKNVIFVDGGIEQMSDGSWQGDFDVNSDCNSNQNIFVSAVPGGVGPITIATLMSNVIDLAKLK